jgi:hypothetical protein
MMSRPYASVLDVIDDLEIDGIKSHANLLRDIYAASMLIDRRGHFVPVTKTCQIDGTGTPTLWIDPLLDVTALTLDGVALGASDYVLLPQSRAWEHGPYTSIELVNLGIWPNQTHNEVSITGQWGLYNDTLDLGVTAAQNTNATSLVVSAAPDLSPGVIVLLGNEQEVLLDYAAPISLNTSLNTAIDDVTQTVTLNTANTVIRGEIVRVEFEQMRVLDVDNKNLLVVRGWNGTARESHNSTTAMSVYREFTTLRAANGTTKADHNTVSVLRVLPPYNVRYLCEQIAALMFKKGQGGFAGKTGNAELGEVFYHNEFPKDPIAEVLNDFRIVTI